MTDEVKNKLIENGLSGYIDLLESQKLDTEELISELNQNDFEKIGIKLIGDQKKILKLFQKQEVIVPEIIEHPVVQRDPDWEEYKRERERQPIIITNVSSGDNSADTSLSGIIGGIIGAVLVIVAILALITNETFSL